MGTGGQPDGRANSGSAPGVREDRLGRAGAGPVRLERRPAPGRERRRPRPCVRGAGRSGDGQEPEHRAAGVGKDLRDPPRLAELQARLEPPGRSGAGESPAAGLSHRTGSQREARRPRPPERPPEDHHRLRGRTHREREHHGSRLPGGRLEGGGSGGPPPGQELHHRPGPKITGSLAAERKHLWQGLEA